MDPHSATKLEVTVKLWTLPSQSCSNCGEFESLDPHSLTPPSYDRLKGQEGIQYISLLITVSRHLTVAT